MPSELAPKPYQADFIRNRRLDEIKERKSIIKTGIWKPIVSVEMVNLNKEEILIENDKKILTSNDPTINDALADIKSHRIESSRLSEIGGALCQEGNEKSSKIALIHGARMLAVAEFLEAKAEAMRERIVNQHPLPTNSPILKGHLAV